MVGYYKRTQQDSLSLGALIPYPLDMVPSQRYRIEQWASYLQEEGISVDLLPAVDQRFMQILYQPGQLVAKASGVITAFWRRALQLTTLPRYDVLFLHRTASIVGPAILERLMTLVRRPILFDFDDAIYKLDMHAANQSFGWLKFPQKTAVICHLSSHVIVGNTYLAEFARQYNPSVTIVPSSIDIDLYQPKKLHKSNGRVVVGWMGSSTSQYHLESFAPFLRQLVTRKDVELRVISDRRPELYGIPCVWRPWSAGREVEELEQFDIGIMPLIDDEWTRGKCAFKALQYMAMGIPAVCADVGMNREVIQHGNNGLLASTSEEWFVNLDQLISNPTLRTQLGQAGRVTVENHYSMHVCARRLASVIHEVVNSSLRQSESLA